MLARPHIDLDHFVTSTLLDIHFYNSRGEKMLAAVELTEIHIDYEFREQLLKNTAHRWMDWIFSAVKRDDIIQTDCGEAYLMIYFTISTIDLLIGVYGRLGKSQLANFPLSMYETYMQLYRGRDKVSVRLLNRFSVAFQASFKKAKTFVTRRGSNPQPFYWLARHSTTAPFGIVG